MYAPRQYELRVEGALDEEWSSWFGGLRVASDASGRTTISGPVADQAALHGLLARVRDLGLHLISVQPAEPRPPASLEEAKNATRPYAGTPRMCVEDARERSLFMSHDQILDLGQRWADAEERADSAALETLLTDDFVAVGPRGFVLNRQQYLERHRLGDLKIEKLSWADVTVREYGAAAIAVGVQTQQAAYQGQDASGRFRVTQVAVHAARRWLIASLHISGPIPEIPPRQE